MALPVNRILSSLPNVNRAKKLGFTSANVMIIRVEGGAVYNNNNLSLIMRNSILADDVMTCSVGHKMI